MRETCGIAVIPLSLVVAVVHAKFCRRLIQTRHRIKGVIEIEVVIKIGLVAPQCNIICQCRPASQFRVQCGCGNIIGGIVPSDRCIQHTHIVCKHNFTVNRHILAIHQLCRRCYGVVVSEEINIQFSVSRQSRLDFFCYSIDEDDHCCAVGTIFIVQCHSGITGIPNMIILLRQGDLIHCGIIDSSINNLVRTNGGHFLKCCGIAVRCIRKLYRLDAIPHIVICFIKILGRRQIIKRIVPVTARAFDQAKSLIAKTPQRLIAHIGGNQHKRGLFHAHIRKNSHIKIIND